MFVISNTKTEDGVLRQRMAGPAPGGGREAPGFSFGRCPMERWENKGVRRTLRRKVAMASSPAELEVRPTTSDSSRLEWHPARWWGTGRPVTYSMERWLRPCTWGEERVRGDEDEEEQGRGGMTHHEELTKKILVLWSRSSPWGEERRRTKLAAWSWCYERI
jgi:hypothetical protein